MFLSNSTSTKESTKFPASTADKFQSALSNGSTHPFPDEFSENNFDSGFSNDKQTSVSDTNVNTETNNLDTDSGNDSTLDPPISRLPCEQTAQQKCSDYVNKEHPNTAQCSHTSEINLNKENSLVDYKEKFVGNGELTKHELENTQFDIPSKLVGHEIPLTSSVSECGSSVVEHSLVGEVGDKVAQDGNQISSASAINGQSVDTLAHPENIDECVSDEEVYLEVDEIVGSDVSESDVEESSQLVVDSEIGGSDQVLAAEGKVGDGEKSSRIVDDCGKTLDTLIDGIDKVNSDYKLSDIGTDAPTISADGPVETEHSKSFDEGNGVLTIATDKSPSAEESQDESMFEEEIFEEMEEYVEVVDEVISGKEDTVDDEVISKNKTGVENVEMSGVDELISSSTSVKSVIEDNDVEMSEIPCPEDPNMVLQASKNDSIDENKSNKHNNNCVVTDSLNEELCVIDDDIREEPMNVSSENNESYPEDPNIVLKTLQNNSINENKSKEEENQCSVEEHLNPKVCQETVSNCSEEDRVQKETKNNSPTESPQKLLDGLDDDFESLIEEFAVKECADENTNQNTPIDKPESPKRATVLLESDDEIEVIMEDFKAADSDDDCLIVEDTSNVINVEKDGSKNKFTSAVVALDVTDKAESPKRNAENEKTELDSSKKLEETSQYEGRLRDRVEMIPFISDSPLLSGGSCEPMDSSESSQLERLSSQIDNVTEESSCDVMMNTLLDRIELDVAAKTNSKLKSISNAEQKDNSKNADVERDKVEGNSQEMDESSCTDILSTKEDHRKRTIDEVERSCSPEMNKKLKEDEIAIEIPYDSNSKIQQSIRGRAIEHVPHENSYKFKTTLKCLDKIVKLILAKSIKDIAPESFTENKKFIDESEEMCQLFNEDLQLFNAKMTSILAEQDEKFHKSNFTPKEVKKHSVYAMATTTYEIDSANHSPATTQTKPSSVTSKGTTTVSNIKSPAPSTTVSTLPNTTTVSTQPLVQSNQAGNPLAAVQSGQIRPASRAVTPVVRPQTSLINPSSVAIPRLTGNQQNVLMPMTVFQIRSNSGNPPQFTSATQLPTGRAVLQSSIRAATAAPRTVAYLMSPNSSQLTPLTARNGISGAPFIAGPAGQRLQTFVVRMTNSGHVPPIGSIVTSTSRLPAPVNTLVNNSTITTATANNGLVLFPRPTLQHPAPFPMPPVQSYNPKLKLVPPKPSLKGARAPHPQTGIILSWNMNVHSSHSEISNYQLFAYQETNAPVTSALWKRVGDVKALPLPMACTLTQFSDNNRYYFTVRACDCHGRLGPFSDPVSIWYTKSKPDDSQGSKK
ncbi:hypothetical protein JTE90_016623 [Oedothorax gibbosus]|uniref:Fibronectin type-III domain-containing protein n=1 Tax=Oedothorax gibbosus TaxID=931172 RepID=A0AAV6UYZ3_9ARAC|nr:hypothetical protein JTE90_016623 [Oedothorax gibbosus]